MSRLPADSPPRHTPDRAVDTLLDEGREALLTEGVLADDLRLLPPVQAPTVRDFVAFEEHVAGMATVVPDEWYDAPTLYFTNPYALIGAGDEVPVPPGCTAVDFELEVAAVIGKAGRDLTSEDTRTHIAGYTILNDWSARDMQHREMRVNLGPCKGKDFATTMGPALVTADELEPYRDVDGFLRLAMSASVNGVEVGHDCCPTWTGHSRTSCPTRREARGCDLVTSWVQAPAGTAGASPNYGAAGACRIRPRYGPVMSSR